MSTRAIGDKRASCQPPGNTSLLCVIPLRGPGKVGQGSSLHPLLHYVPYASDKQTGSVLSQVEGSDQEDWRALYQRNVG
jgi:hypothetical protein